MEKDSLKEKTLSSLFWKLFERGGASAVLLIVQIVMARLLAPDDFGALVIMLVFVNIGNVMVQSGLNTALVQSQEADADDFSTVFWMSFAISLFLCAIVFAAAPAVANFYDMGHLVWPLRCLAPILVINSYNAVQIAYVQRELEFRKVFRATIASATISGCAGIGAAVAGAGLWALIVQQLAYQVVNCVVLAFQVPWKPRFIFVSSRAKRLFSFGWKLLASHLLDAGYQSLADLIIGKQFTAADLGLVSQGKKYPQALGQMLDGAIQPVMLSAAARVQYDLPRVKRLVRRALKTSSFLIMPCMTLLALTAAPLVNLILGEKWLPCVWFLQVYCVDYALLPIHASNLQALNAMGRSDLFLKLEVVKKAYAVVLMLFAVFVLKSVYWVVGFSVIASVINVFINAWPSRRVIGYSYREQLRDIAPGVGLSLASAAIAWPLCLTGLPDVVLVVAQVVVMAAAYLGLSKLFRVEALEYLVATFNEILSDKKA